MRFRSRANALPLQLNVRSIIPHRSYHFRGDFRKNTTVFTPPFKLHVEPGVGAELVGGDGKSCAISFMGNDRSPGLLQRATLVSFNKFPPKKISLMGSVIDDRLTKNIFTR